VSTTLTVNAGSTLKVLSAATLMVHQLNLSSSATANFSGGVIDLVNTGASITAQTFDLNAGGTLEGQGTINGNMINEGTTDAFQLLITGNFTQPPTGTLFWRLAEPPTTIEGFAQFGGTLDVVIPGSPAVHSIYQVLSLTTEQGAFQNLILPTLPQNEFWNTAGLYTTGTISIVPEPSLFAPALCAGLLTLRRYKRLGRPE
jgi:hypothetical protein